MFWTPITPPKKIEVLPPSLPRMKTQTLPVNQVRELDKKAELQFGIPSLILMENAGLGLARCIRSFLIPPINQCNVVMVCGTGNNGGDAFVAARHLFRQEIVASVFLVGEESHLKGDAEINFRIIKKLGLSIEPISRFTEKQIQWSRLPVLVVDAILGTGFQSELREPALSAVQTINKFKRGHNCSVKVLSVDIPTGLDGDKGPIGKDVVRADMTVTLACLKPGLLLKESKEFVGRVEVVDIGIPESLYKGEL